MFLQKKKESDNAVTWDNYKPSTKSQLVPHRSNSKRFSNVCYCPENGATITIHNSQVVIIRMPMPALMLNDVSADLWSASQSNPEIIKITPKIDGSSTLVFQDFHINVIEYKIPQAPGVYQLGTVKIKHGDKENTYFIKYHKSFNSETNVNKPENINTTNDSKVKSIRFVKSWKNNDDIVVSPYQHLYVKPPFWNKDWEENAWDLSVEQCPMPTGIWDELKKSFDTNLFVSPHFSKETKSMLSFRSLETKFGKHTNEVLEIIKKKLDLNYLPLANCKFTNTKHVSNSVLETEYGKYTSQKSLEVGFRVFLDLSEIKVPKLVTYVDPKEQDEIIISHLDTFCITLQTRTYTNKGEIIEEHWFVTKFPNHVLSSMETKKVYGKTEFRFAKNKNNVKTSGYLEFRRGTEANGDIRRIKISTEIINPEVLAEG